MTFSKSAGGTLFIMIVLVLSMSACNEFVLAQDLQVDIRRSEILPFEPIHVKVVFTNTSTKDITINKNGFRGTIRFQIRSVDTKKWGEPRINHLIPAKKQKPRKYVVHPGKKYVEQFECDLRIKDPGDYQVRFIRLRPPKLISAPKSVKVTEPGNADKRILRYLQSQFSDDGNRNVILGYSWTDKGPWFKNREVVGKLKSLIVKYPNAVYARYIAYELCRMKRYLDSNSKKYLPEKQYRRYLRLATISKQFPFYEEATRMLKSIEKE